MAAPPMHVLRLGFRFEPTPMDAVTYYLPRLVASEPMPPVVHPFIHRANVYADAPGALAARFCPTPVKDDRFFFTEVERQKKSGSSRQGTTSVRYARVAGAGSWTFQRSDDVKDGDANKVGEVRKLRYKGSDGVNTDWLMEEYSCANAAVVAGNKEQVFCRIYVSPNAGADSAARQESAAFFAPPQPVQTPPPVTNKKMPEPAPPIAPATNKRPAPPAIVIAPAASKRPAPPPIAKPPCPKRIRGAPISPRRPPPSAGCLATPSFPPPQPQIGGMVRTPMMMQPVRSPIHHPVQAPAPPPQQPSIQTSTPSKLCTPHRDVVPSATKQPATAPAIRMPMQVQASHQQFQASTVTPPDHCPSVARDPFSSEPPAPVADQDSDDLELAQLIEAVLEQEPPAAPVADEDGDDLVGFAQFIDDFLEEAEPAAARVHTESPPYPAPAAQEA